jgi:translation initiation factor 1 (eIF-1/SUI1)
MFKPFDAGSLFETSCKSESLVHVRVIQRPKRKNKYDTYIEGLIPAYVPVSDAKKVLKIFKGTLACNGSIKNQKVGGGDDDDDDDDDDEDKEMVLQLQGEQKDKVMKILIKSIMVPECNVILHG